jgi:DNA repair protein RecO (recombination protein O)
MITEALSAWVLHKYWSGDTSARVVFFTRQYGVVNCLYKGGRTPKKQALLQPFTELWLVMNIRGDSFFVRDLEIAAPQDEFLGKNLFSALYMNELLHYTLRPQDPDVTLKALSRAEGRLSIEAILRRFEWVFLKACGYEISFTHDARTAQLISDKNFYRLVPGEGFILVDKGISGAHLMAMADDDLSDAMVLNASKKIMRQAIDYALDGRVIRARALYINK